MEAVRMALADLPANVQMLVDGICEETEGALLWAT